MKVLLALSLLFNVALAAWIAVDFTKKAASAPVVHSNDWKSVSDRLGRSLASQSDGLLKEVALRDSLTRLDPAWIDSQERSDILRRAKELDQEARRELVAAGSIPDSDLQPSGD